MKAKKFVVTSRGRTVYRTGSRVMAALVVLVRGGRVSECLAC